MSSKASHAPPAADPADSSKERLLKAATELFARRGFDGVSIRELAEAANVNVAAVHYHFGGKTELYRAVIEAVFAPLRSVLTAQQQAIALARESSEPSAVRQALEVCIRGLMTRLFHQERPSWAGTFLARESVQPSSAMDRVFECLVRPAWEAFLEVLELIRPDLAETEQLRFVASSIVGQCLYYQHARPVVLATFQLATLDDDFIERAVAHIAAFSFAAISLPSAESRQ
jgi:TetR/AcrR family transcriptional regulator, regulator of cefoperazone and chloramphenicol sensitivity